MEAWNFEYTHMEHILNTIINRIGMPIAYTLLELGSCKTKFHKLIRESDAELSQASVTAKGFPNFYYANSQKDFIENLI